MKQREEHDMTSDFKNCPFCGSLPRPDIVKHHNAGEPYWTVVLQCTGCGVRMSTVANDQDCEEATRISASRYEKGESLIHRADLVAHVVIKNCLLHRWNTRAVE